MIKIVTSLSLVSISLTSFADITVIKTELKSDSQAQQIGRSLTVINPYIQVDGKKALLSEYSSVETLCSMLGDYNAVGIEKAGSSENDVRYSISSTGALSETGTVFRPDNGYVIGLLKCTSK